MKPYRYHINFGPYGADLVAYALIEDQFIQWEHDPLTASVDHLSTLIELRHLKGPWYEEDTELRITDLSDGSIVLESDLGALNDHSTAVIDHKTLEGPLLIIETESKGSYQLTLELDQPFDLSECQVVGEHFRFGYGVVTHLRYLNEIYDLTPNTHQISIKAFIDG